MRDANVCSTRVNRWQRDTDWIEQWREWTDCWRKQLVVAIESFFVATTDSRVRGSLCALKKASVL